MVSVKKLETFFYYNNLPTFNLEEEINILILKSFFNAEVKKDELYFEHETSNNSFKIFVLQIHIKLFEINYFLLEDKQNFNREKIEQEPFLKDKKVYILQKEIAEKLIYLGFKKEEIPNFTSFLLFLYQSKINNLSKITELKKYSFLSSLFCCEDKILKEKYESYFIFLHNLYCKKITIVKEKDDLLFLIILSLQVLENFYLEIGFTASNDPYGMRRFLSGILKNVSNTNVDIFLILKQFPRIETLIHNKLQNEKYSKNFNVTKVLMKNEDIKNIFHLDKFFYYYNLFSNYKSTIKRIRNFCNKNSLTNDEHIDITKDFYLHNKNFLFINTYLDIFSLDKEKYNEEKLFFSVESIFDTDHIKNSLFEKEKVYIIHKLNFFLKKFLL